MVDNPDITDRTVNLLLNPNNEIVGRAGVFAKELQHAGGSLRAVRDEIDSPIPRGDPPQFVLRQRAFIAWPEDRESRRLQRVNRVSPHPVPQGGGRLANTRDTGAPRDCYLGPR